MNPTLRNEGSTLGVLIGGICMVAIAVLGVSRLKEARDEFVDRIETLQSKLGAAEARSEELQNELTAERTARELAESQANESRNAVAQAREELRTRQDKLGTRIQQLEASVQQCEQQVAAAVDARTRMEMELAAQIEQRKALERELASVNDRLLQQEAIVNQLPRPAGADARAGPLENPAETGTVFDTPPRPVDLVSPEYPSALRQQGTEGHVLVSFTVDAQGRVGEVEVREATNPEFEAAAVAAVRKWRFRPALRNSEPVGVRISQRLEFNRRN